MIHESHFLSTCAKYILTCIDARRTGITSAGPISRQREVAAFSIRCRVTGKGINVLALTLVFIAFVYPETKGNAPGIFFHITCQSRIG